MRNNDAKLIERILEGDDVAFASLVRKYQKRVHTLAWRKIGDFHIAEDITQETFLLVYRNLAKLKDPSQFPGWLYVIANRRCLAWLRKKRNRTQPLEEIDIAMTEGNAYSRHVAAEQTESAAETKRELVKNLLAKLKESDRTVITLYYFGEMTYAEISEFLGVSVNTVAMRIHRARERLKKYEPMIREALGSFQLSPNLTENIMREIPRIKPLPPTGGKPPIVPWAIATSTAILVVMMFGVSNQYLARFQQPYSFDVTSEMTVEIVDASIVIDLPSKPDVQSQSGRAVTPNEGNGSGHQPHAASVIFTPNQLLDQTQVSVQQQWIGVRELGGTPVMTLFPASEGELYIVSGKGNIYKLPAHRGAWQHVKNVNSLVDNWKGKAPMMEWHNTLYIVLSNELFASTNNGETWRSVGNCPKGNTVGLLVRNDMFYLAYENGIFRSDDIGKTWVPMNDGLTGKINALNAIENILFAGTDTGLYRFNGTSWQLIQFPESQAVRIQAMASGDNTLYVAAGVDFRKLDGGTLQQIFGGHKRSWWIFRSTDNGRSWTEITPTNVWPILGHLPPIVLVATEKILLILGMNDGVVVRSTNGGYTWISEKNTGISSTMFSVSNAVALDDTTFYAGGNSGIHRSIDGGKSWERFNIKLKSRIDNLTCIPTNKQQNTPEVLYAIAGIEIFKSNNGGRSWSAVSPEIQITAPYREEPPLIFNILVSGALLYAKGETIGDSTGLYQVSTDTGALISIDGVPSFHSRELVDRLSQTGSPSFEELKNAFVEHLQEDAFGATQFFRQLVELSSSEAENLIRGGLRGAFAVSGDTFYMEYNFKLFRWRRGETQWYETGVQETAQLSGHSVMKGFKIAVLGDTVYVGKRDGHLMQSLDAGNNWNDVTKNLPFPVDVFNEIVFVGATVYVATNNGVIASQNGRNWYPVTDTSGTCLVMEQLAVSPLIVYGTSKTGVYQLKHDSNTWKQFGPKVPAVVTSLAVGDNGLYVGTESSGIMYFKVKNDE